MAKRGYAFISALLLLSSFMVPSPARAQTVTGTIQGTVVDTSGAVLPGVTVTLKQLNTATERVVVTNGSGFYSATYIPIGPYTVTATLAGFGSVVRENIQLGLNDTRVVDFTLDPRVSESVTVTAVPPPINVTSGQVKSGLTADQIMEKPSASASNFLTLAETFPGFQENPTSGQNNPTSSSGSSINFNNTGTRGATFQINGVNNDDSSENQNRQGVALSTIQEFQVLKNGYSAEFGRGDGAVVLVQTKSGTNKLSGDGYWYKQNNDWNARTWFPTPKPVNQRSEYGFTVGFPIVANKLFAFGNLDRTSFDGQNGYTRDIITAADKSVPWLTRGNDTPENRAWIQSILDRFPSSLTPNDPRSARTYAGIATFSYPDSDYSGRADYNWNQNNTLTGRYQYTHQLRQPQDVIVGEQAWQDNKQQNLGMTWTHVVNTSLVGEARYGLGLRSTNVNIADGNDTPVVRFSGMPVSGPIIGNAGAFPINRDQKDHQFVYNLTWQAFRQHSFKAGLDVRRQALDDFADNFSRGFWSFNPTCGGTTYATSIAAFFDGCVPSFQKAYGPLFLENRMNESNVYAQDDWRIRDNLTVNLGVRYEYVNAPKEAKNRIDYIYGADTNNIEPRLGVAYTPKWDSGFLRTLSGGTGNLSFRGGYGIYDGRIFQSIFSQSGASVRFNPPNAILKAFSTTPNILNIADPSMGFVFVPGPQVGRVSLTLPDKNLEMPSTTKWNLTVERVLPWTSAVRVTYSGNYNNKRLKYAYGNLPQLPENGPILVVNHPNNAPTGTFPDLRGKYITAYAADMACAGTGFYGLAPTTQCPNTVPIADNEISFRVPRTNERRPDPLYTTNLLIANAAEAWYEGIEFEWVKRMSKGLDFQVAYTFSSSKDTTSEATAVGTGDSNANGPNQKYSKAYSRFHTPHRFTFNGSYRLPFLLDRKDWVGMAFGGWQISAVVKLASGTPYTVIDTARDLDLDGFSESRPVLLDPSVIGVHVNNRDTSQQVLPLSAFRSTVPGDTIDMLVPRNAFYTDGTQNVDMAIMKNFAMPWAGQSLMVRVEAFNAFNSVQFGFPNNNVTGAAFSAINGTAAAYRPRTIQFVLRYRY